MATHDRLKNRVAIVTGGTKGIGQGVVLRYLKEGATVVYCSRNPDNDAENKALIAALDRGPERALFVAADVGDKQQMISLVETAVDKFGRIDIVVNNAQGIAPLVATEEKPDADFAMTLATGFYQSLWTAQAAFPHMKAQRHGRIINFSSHWAMWGERFGADYAITKNANEALTRSLANEWGKFGITVNCITPAGHSYAYDQYKSFNPESCEVGERQMPSGRLGDCETEVASCLLGLASDNGRYITGQTFFVDGGAWCQRPLTTHVAGTDIHQGRTQAAANVH